MREQPPPARRWAAYRTRYRWRAVFDGVGRPDVLDRVEFVNGERDAVRVPAPEAAADPTDAPRPAPRFVLFTDPAAQRNHWVTLDDEEVAAAFARAGADGRAVDLVVAPAAGGAPGVRIAVRSDAATVPLVKVQQESYAARAR